MQNTAEVAPLDLILDAALRCIEQGRDPRPALGALQSMAPGKRMLLIARQLVEAAYFFEERGGAANVVSALLDQAKVLLPRLSDLLPAGATIDDLAPPSTVDPKPHTGLKVPAGGMRLRGK